MTLESLSGIAFFDPRHTMVQLFSFAALAAAFATSAVAVDPAALYDGGFGNAINPQALLRIGNGGAGQSGLVKALADAFIQDRAANGSTPFLVAWYTSDTTYSIKYLQTGVTDVAITYNPAAEQIAIDQGIASPPSYYIFRDHFLLVGPPSNPARISNSSSVLALISALHEAAEKGNSNPPVRFLSRFDKSATNIKESLLWLGTGQVPWATAYSAWYHQYIAFPIQALTAAILLQEYTLTDRGTYLSLPEELRSRTVVYKAGTDDEADLLLNPGRLLIGEKAENKATARVFAEWLVGNAGQDVIRGFKKGGERLYSPAP